MATINFDLRSKVQSLHNLTLKQENISTQISQQGQTLFTIEKNPIGHIQLDLNGQTLASGSTEDYDIENKIITLNRDDIEISDILIVTYLSTT